MGNAMRTSFQLAIPELAQPAIGHLRQIISCFVDKICTVCIIKIGSIGIYNKEVANETHEKNCKSVVGVCAVNDSSPVLCGRAIRDGPLTYERNSEDAVEGAEPRF